MMKVTKGVWGSVCLLILCGSLHAQQLITGRVADLQTGEILTGASVRIEGTRIATVTGLDGTFVLKTEGVGASMIIFSHLGYKILIKEVELTATGTLDLGGVFLETGSIGLNDVVVTSSLAVSRKTPVALSVIPPGQIERKLSNQEFPEVLKYTPGIYTTKQGGGYGDARLNLRGFESPNVAVMVNGVPMNDMEWGGVYWSNWAGLADVTRSLQVQRGLGASKVSAPSVGGSVNIVTQSTDAESGGAISYMTGNDGYHKVAFHLSTGLSEKGWALTLLGSRTQGDGYIQGTEFEAYSWFVNVSKVINKNHQLSLTAFGAPQWHNQRFNGDRLLEEDWKELKERYRFNPTYGFGVDGQRIVANYNRYHKPQISLNHLWEINESSSLSTVLYLSLGSGGGYGWRGTSVFELYGTNSSTGKLNTRYRNPMTGYMDYTALQEENATRENGSRIVLTEARNNHIWTGLISTYSTRFGKHVDFYGGVDFRYYEGLHDTKIVDLMGGRYFIDASRAGVKDPEKNTGADFMNEPLKTGDVVFRDNTGYVVQEGVFAQAEYNRQPLNLYLSGSFSNSTYWKRDRFYYASGNEKSKSKSFAGFNIKGGGNYNINQYHNLFINAGYLSRAPYMSGGYFSSIHTSNNVNKKAINEKSWSIEGGYGYRSRYLSGRLNFYYTSWMDRTMVKGYGSDLNAFLNLKGMDARHKGIELELTSRPFEGLTLTGTLSLGDWEWRGNMKGYIYDANGQPSNGTEVVEEFGPAHQPIVLEMKGVKVGNSAQTTFSLGADYRFTNGIGLSVDYLHYADNYADYGIDIPNAGTTYKYYNPWKIPDAGVMDAAFQIPFKIGKLSAQFLGNINNLWDNKYVSDARDLTPREAEKAHSASVMYGFGRTFTVGLKLDF